MTRQRRTPDSHRVPAEPTVQHIHRLHQRGSVLGRWGELFVAREQIEFALMLRCLEIDEDDACLGVVEARAEFAPRSAATSRSPNTACQLSPLIFDRSRRSSYAGQRSMRAGLLT